MVKLEAGEQVLGRYTLEALIGQGGMGQVWRARHDALLMPVAIKTLLAEDEALTRRLEQEARLMARVQHPNICRILDFGMHGRIHCIVLELLSGEDLDARLRREESMSWERACPLILGLLDGLDAVHRAGLLHRDIKPSNVWLLESPPDTPKLMDFGIARGASLDATRLTTTGMLVGTPAYMAPEVLWGEDASAASDLYAVGLVLYELLTGKLPFIAETMAQVMRRLREPIDAPLIPAKHPPLPQRVELCLMGLLASKPTHRLTLDATRDALSRALRGAPTPSPTPTYDLLPAPPRDVTPASTHAPTQTFEAPGTLSGAPAAATRGYGLLGARLPASRLAAPAERAWLAQLVSGEARGVTLGDQLWFALWEGEDADSVEWRMMEVEQQLRDRYGELAAVSTELLDGPLKLSPAMWSGAAPLPAPMQRMMSLLRGA